MSLSTSLPAFMTNIIQSNYLAKEFLQALRPASLFRREAVRAPLAAEAGQTITRTRRGLMQPSLTKIAPGADPTTGSYSIEQWTTTFDRYGKSLDTRLTNSAVAIVNKFMEDAMALAEHAGWTVDRLARNSLFMPYVGGRTFSTAIVTSVTALPVAALNGFRYVTDSNGTPQAVSASNPLTVTVDAVANTVTGTIPDDANYPDGPGSLVLGTAVTLAATRKVVLAANKPYISLPSGVTSIDGITSSSTMTFSQILKARERLKKDRVPTFGDGTYHMHLCENHMTALLEDSTFKQIYQGQPNTQEMRDGILVKQYGITFYENTDCPNTSNVSEGVVSSGSYAKAAKEFGGETTNENGTGVELNYSIMLGGRSLLEDYVPDERLREQMAGRIQLPGYTGGFLDNGGFGAEMEGITYIIRPPMDRYLETVSQSWKHDAGWAAPSDEMSTTSTARYKRAVVLASA